MTAAFMASHPGGHPDDEQLELLAMDRLPPHEDPAVRAHLMECDECCLRLIEVADEITLVRAALRSFRPADEP